MYSVRSDASAVIHISILRTASVPPNKRIAADRFAHEIMAFRLVRSGTRLADVSQVHSQRSRRLNAGVGRLSLCEDNQNNTFLLAFSDNVGRVYIYAVIY